MSNRSVLYELQVNLTDRAWGVDCLLDQSLIGPVQYGWDRYKKDPESMTFGGGLLAGSPLPGTRRMIFCGYSPQWENFYVSALGGAMFVFHRLGVNYVWIRGQCEVPSVLVLQLQDGQYSVELRPMPDYQSIWDGFLDRQGREWKGFYALQRAIFEQFGSRFQGDYFRILALGPAAAATNFGAIGSNAVKDGDLTTIDDWAGRGGLGSRLLQHHRLVGIIFGGDWSDPALSEGRALDEYFLEHFGQRAIATDLLLSEKYRYVPKFETGGTFGVNMHTADDRLFSFNFSSVSQPNQKRLEQHEHLILNHYLRQFNEEIIVQKNYAHCGEPCAVACKKYFQEYKKDYEPYQALGPNCGIFDQRAAELLNRFVDTSGADSIHFGAIISWVMELIWKEMIDPADFGLPPRDQMNFEFASRQNDFDIEKDSMANASYACQIGKMILSTPQGEIFRNGFRPAIKALDTRYSIQSGDLAVYYCNGENGSMGPNQYWVPGMFSPMPLMGKYFCYYNVDYLPPFELGRKNVERFVYELYSENSGSCRFHRKWVEDIIDEIILSHFDLKINYWQDNFNLAKEIHINNRNQCVPWESGRVVEIIYQYLKKWKEDGLQDPTLDDWLEEFTLDPRSAALAYWNEILRGIDQAFAEGMDEPAHQEHGFLQRDKRG